MKNGESKLYNGKREEKALLYNLIIITKALNMEDGESIVSYYSRYTVIPHIIMFIII